MEKPEILLLDGGMGTMLQAAGLPLGCPPELWNVTEPEKVAASLVRWRLWVPMAAATNWRLPENLIS